MDLFSFSPDAILSFLLTLFRISIILFLLPFFGGETIPRLVKFFLCLVLAFGLWPALSFPGQLMPTHPVNLAIMLLGEAILGLILGLIVRLVFAAVQTGGQLIGFQMGFAMINIVDPITGISEAVTAHFLYMVTLLTFLALQGHLYLLSGLAATFKYIPPGGLLLSEGLASGIFELSAQMFVLAIKIASPVMATLFLVDLSLALIAKAAPQMNVLFVGFPLKIAVGFLFLSLVFTLVAKHIQKFINQMGPLFMDLLKAAQG